MDFRFWICNNNKVKLLAVTILLIGLTLTACTTGNNAPTPTIVPLDGSATAQSRLQFDDAPPTATRLPPPSPTPTQTPMSMPILTPEAVTPDSQISAVQPQAEVIVAALNVRQGPGVDYPIVAVAYAGDVFDVVGVNALGDWLKVAAGDDNLGWISGQNPYTRLLGSGLDNVSVVQSPPPPSISAEGGKANGTTDSDGKLIFMTGSGGELYTVNIDGSDLRRLTGGVIDPVVSPDGRQAAFTRWDGAEFGVLYVINVDGSGERSILGDIRQPKSPTWSPDGRKIILSFQHGGLRDPEEECKHFGPGQKLQIPRSRVKITKFGVSSDGSVNVCFIRFEDLHWGLRQVDVLTGAFEDLSSDTYTYNPSWDPQNPWRVVYDGEWGLVQLDITNGKRWFLTEDLRDSGPVFSPDGKKLALTYKQHDHWEVYTLDLETGVRQRLTKPSILADPQYSSAAPAWSPDGLRLAFVTDRAGQWEIWVMNVDGSNQRPLFAPEIQTRLNLEYRGFNERMLNWID